MAGEGRIRRGLRLVRQSWDFLRERPRMLALPLLSAVVMTTATAALVAAALQADDGSGWAFFVAFAVGAWPLTIVGNFFNVAFLAMAADATEGHEPTVAGGLRSAEARLGPIVAWSALATLVGLLLQAVRQIPFVGEWVGQALAFAGGLAWGLATYFVVPIIVLHGTGARESVRRSSRTFKERWGETVTGDFAIGTATMLVVLPAALAVGAGVVVWSKGSAPAGAALIAAGVSVGVSALTISNALNSLFQLFVYRHVALETSDGPYAVADLERAARPRKPPFWRR